MLKRRKKIAYAIVAFIVALTVGLIIGIYSVVINGIVENNVINTISEIASHDRNTITNYVEFNWKNLERFSSRLNRNQGSLTDDDKVVEYLKHESQESSFDKIYMITEDGTYYTDLAYRHQNSVVNGENIFYDFMPILQTKHQNMVGFDALPILEYDKVAIYGHKLEDEYNIKVGSENRTVIAAIGVARRSTITSGLVLESFLDGDGECRGLTTVVDLKGDIIVNKVDSDKAEAGNWFRNIQTYEKTDMSWEEVRQNMTENKTFLFRHTNGGKSRVSYCMPFDDNIDWYFRLTVDYEALNEQGSPFIMLVIIALAILVSVSVVALIIVLRTQNKTEQALAREKAQSEFLSNMSHEIRTPLNGLVGLNYLMITAIDDPSKKNQVKAWLSKSHSTSKYLLALINDILDVSKLRAGKVEVVKEPLLIEALVDAIFSMQCDNIKNRGIEYSTDVKITVPCILGDEVHIKQVLMNIISNAAKFTPAGGFIKLSVRQIKTDETHVTTTFICEDSGCGMSKEFLTKIFDVFTQERNSDSDSIKGTGLGMPISKLLVNAMDGEIKVESELNKGSKFTISIPAEISDIPDYLNFNVDEEAERMAQAYKSETESMKVLIAEDNELNAEILIEILKDSGFEVGYAVDGSQAVEMFAQSKPNEYGVVLMDMRMPVMDGCEASKKIRSLDRPDAKTVPIFACTANSFKEDRIKAFDSGMNDFLTKPIDIKALLQKMENLRSGNTDGKKE
ncbi:MAG: response regulator [Clostridia bacterium]|nr:response regulator [Clostridia bacterium]